MTSAGDSKEQQHSLLPQFRYVALVRHVAVNLQTCK